jgi:hypothetical protein
MFVVLVGIDSSCAVTSRWGRGIAYVPSMPRTEGPECRRFRRQRKHDTARRTREEAPRLVPTPIGSRAAAFDLADDAANAPVPARTHEPTDQSAADPQAWRSLARWHDQMSPRHVAPSASSVHCADRRARAARDGRRPCVRQRTACLRDRYTARRMRACGAMPSRAPPEKAANKAQQQSGT